jgi:hypothetical protein
MTFAQYQSLRQLIAEVEIRFVNVPLSYPWKMKARLFDGFMWAFSNVYLPTVDVDLYLTAKHY